MGNSCSLPDLYAAIERYRHTPFAWGVHDCALFSANVTLACTGKDYAAPFRERYHTKTGAYKALKPYGGLAGVLCTLFQDIPVAFAGRGDVVLKDGCLGVCLGRNAAFVTEAHGLTFYPTLSAERAWHVT